MMRKRNKMGSVRKWKTLLRNGRLVIVMYKKNYRSPEIILLQMNMDSGMTYETRSQWDASDISGNKA